MRVDAHQHFWKFNPDKDIWITDDMAVIRKDFLPQHLEPLLKDAGFDGCVVVQSDQSLQENIFQLNNATEHAFIKGVVGWVDLQANNIHEQLQEFSRYKKLKGFRHVLQGESQRDLMLSPNFVRGIALLRQFEFTYDILIFPDQLIYAKNLAAQFPEQKFVIDHLAKPAIQKKEIKEWMLDIESIAKLPNVWCKLSGMVTEANWKGWRKDDFRPYMDVIVESFGIDRVMFGSDWPVCLVAASYEEVVDIVKDYFAAFSNDEQHKVFGFNASQFYNF
ncbi:MAG: amidohydrolase [Chitinophagaceae bacterium]|nr:MAG: amidohydrolase [Chitinophagaceae bacterium]